MTDFITIRDATPADAEAISALIHSLVPLFVEDRDAADTFLQTLEPAVVRSALSSEEFFYRVAERSSELVGVVGTRNKTHIYHLFVKKRFHRQGIGERLFWDIVGGTDSPANPVRHTVNASYPAIAFYERLGFVAAGPLVRQDGLCFLPMLRER